MKDKGKAKEQLIEELQGLRKRNAELEVLVTKHKETENLLQVERDRFKTILETNPCGIYIVDQQHNTLIRLSKKNSARLMTENVMSIFTIELNCVRGVKMMRCLQENQFGGSGTRKKITDIMTFLIHQ
jgi:hypothetical protein